jgi:pimeloyl-ACP methyl ester carboxylesterase
MSAVRHAYLHGFASSAASKKGVHLRGVLASRGVDLLLPDLNRPSFEKLSVGAMLEHLDRVHVEQGEPRWRLVGSSLGGWLAARWAELHPERVDRLVLLCPAFDIPTRWPLLLPPGAFDRWERDGELPYADAQGRVVPLHFGFVEEARAHTPYPSVGCPATVVHGTRDDRVPIESSRRWLADHPQARLVVVDDGHDLMSSLPAVERAITDTFGI